MFIFTMQGMVVQWFCFRDSWLSGCITLETPLKGVEVIFPRENQIFFILSEIIIWDGVLFGDVFLQNILMFISSIQIKFHFFGFFISFGLSWCLWYGCYLDKVLIFLDIALLPRWKIADYVFLRWKLVVSLLMVKFWWCL